MAISRYLVSLVALATATALPAASEPAEPARANPAVLRAPVPVIEREVAATLESFGAGPGHVFNLGHGITPDIDPEHVAALVAAIHRGIP